MTDRRRIRVATRKSRLARVQTDLAIAHFSQHWPDVDWEIIPMSTQGDEKLQWSLQSEGGKGLFTSELERAIVSHEADLAVHSAKDLPTEMTEGVALAGFLERAPVHDVLVIRDGVDVPKLIATSSPRRRAQLAKLYSEVSWTEIRGNVETRLKKIAAGEADATVLAAAGLLRLGIESFPGVHFEPIAIETCVPAAGQGAVGIQVRIEDVELYRPLLCDKTWREVSEERRILAEMGGGCHSACAVYCGGEKPLVFNEL